MTSGFLAYFEELPDLSHTTIRVAEDQYDAREGCISQHAPDAPNVFVYKRGDLSGNERGVFYFKRLRPLGDCYELEKWLGGNRTKFPVTGGWGIIGEGHDCRTDIFGALLLQIFREIALYYLDAMSRFEDITTNCRQLLAIMENQTASWDTNIFVNPDAIILEKILTKSVRIVLANRDLTRELSMRKKLSQK